MSVFHAAQCLDAITAKVEAERKASAEEHAAHLARLKNNYEAEVTALKMHFAARDAALVAIINEGAEPQAETAEQAEQSAQAFAKAAE